MNGYGKRKRFLGLAVVALSTSACATSTQTTIADNAPPAGKVVFKKIPVIGVANDYEGRTRFERRVARDLTAAGAAATAIRTPR